MHFAPFGCPCFGDCHRYSCHTNGTRCFSAFQSWPSPPALSPRRVQQWQHCLLFPVGVEAHWFWWTIFYHSSSSDSGWPSCERCCSSSSGTVGLTVPNTALICCLVHFSFGLFTKPSEALVVMWERDECRMAWFPILSICFQCVQALACIQLVFSS